MLSNVKLASPLSRKATLVSLEISQWTARKFDKKVTSEVNRRHNAADDAGRYNKSLVQRERLERITTLVSTARSLFYKYTKPWAEGLGILPNTLHAQFAKEFREIQRQYDEAADDFARDFPTFVQEQSVRLNGLFNPADYPAAGEIRDKFKMVVKPYPVPDADDFRSDVLDADMIEDIKREIAAASEASEKAIADSTVKQITEVVGHMATKLAEYKSGTSKAKGEKKNFFTDSLVGNVRTLAELLPHFNLHNDPKLTALTDRIKSELCVEEPKTLRESETVRASVQKSADEILKDVSALLG